MHLSVSSIALVTELQGQAMLFKGCKIVASKQHFLQHTCLLHATEVQAEHLLMDSDIGQDVLGKKTCGILHADSC